MKQFSKYGEFVEPWVDANTANLWHHMDYKDEAGKSLTFWQQDLIATTYQRGSELPEDVKVAVAFDKWPRCRKS